MRGKSSQWKKRVVKVITRNTSAFMLRATMSAHFNFFRLLFFGTLTRLALSSSLLVALFTPRSARAAQMFVLSLFTYFFWHLSGEWMVEVHMETVEDFHQRAERSVKEKINSLC
jgi:hypothetical protein